jgi:hypothetical protein
MVRKKTRESNDIASVEKSTGFRIKEYSRRAIELLKIRHAIRFRFPFGGEKK